jgi:hypothetical protein
MAISEKQLKANRENAKKGGVKTDEGKRRSKLNALKHGMLLSIETILPGEDQKTFANLATQLKFEISPRGFWEELLVDRLISSIWRLRRVLRTEVTLIMEHLENYINADPSLREYMRLQAEGSFIKGPSVDTLLRYEAAIERQIYKAFDKLIERRKLLGMTNPLPGPTLLDLPLDFKK